MLNLLLEDKNHLILTLCAIFIFFVYNLRGKPYIKDNKMERPMVKSVNLLPVLMMFLFLVTAVFTANTAEANTLPVQTSVNNNAQLAWWGGGWHRGYRGGWGWGYRGGYYRGGYPAYWGPRCARYCWIDRWNVRRCNTRCN